MFNTIQKQLEKRTEPLLLYKKQRWIFTVSIFVTYLLRVLYLEAYFAISYLLGFHLMKMSIGFLTPKGIPSIIDEDAEEEQGLYDIDQIE
jgi:Rer1 family